MCYSNSVSFIELLRSFCIHGEVCAKILCSEKELLNLKDSKLTQNFYGNKTGFVRSGHIYIYIYILAMKITDIPYRGKHWRVATLANSLQKHVDEINFGEFEVPAKFYLI